MITEMIAKRLRRSALVRRFVRTRLGRRLRTRARAFNIWRIRMQPANRAHDMRQARILKDVDLGDTLVSTAPHP